MTRGSAFAVVTLCLCACEETTRRPPRPPPVEESNSKAFAALEKSGRDEAKPRSRFDDTPATGPVYQAPFTVEQIREATKNGRQYRFKVETPDKPPREYTVEFRNVDNDGAEVVTADAAERVTWPLLLHHAEFPRDKVTTREEKLKTPAGKFECIVYEVVGEPGEKATYYFARKLPGAPVFFYVDRDGKRVRTTTLIDHLPGT